MGTTKGPYQAEYPIGSQVIIKNTSDLETFLREWKYHNPITKEQLRFANSSAVVEEVGYYFVGDELYKLQGIPGVWHECCLTLAKQQ